MDVDPELLAALAAACVTPPGGGDIVDPASLPATGLRLAADLSRQYARIPKVACRGLCWRACGPIGFGPYEARRITTAAAKAGVPVTIRRHEQGWYGLDVTAEGLCPALTADHRCAIYEARPGVCRAYGALLPVLACGYGCVPSGAGDAATAVFEASQVGTETETSP